MDEQRLSHLKSMPYAEYLQTPEWAEKRKEALERDGSRCRLCNSEDNLQVHHRTYRRRGAEDVDDLTTLCQTCHESFHDRISQNELMKITGVDKPLPLSYKEEVQKVEDFLIGVLLQYPSLVSQVQTIMSEKDFVGAETQALYTLLCTHSLHGQSIEQSILTSFMPTVTRAREAVKHQLLGTPLTQMVAEKDVMIVASRLKREHIFNALDVLYPQITEARAKGETVLLRQLQQQVVNCHQQLRATEIKGIAYSRIGGRKNADG